MPVHIEDSIIERFPTVSAVAHEQQLRQLSYNLASLLDLVLLCQHILMADVDTVMVT